MMELNRKTMQRIILILFCAALFFVGFQHLDVVWRFIGTLVGFVSPFLIGFAIAFVLSVPLRFVENRLFARLNQKNKPLWRRLRRPLSMVLTIALVLGVVVFVLVLVIPEMAAAFGMLREKFPAFWAETQSWAQQALPDMAKYLEQFQFDWKAVGDTLSTLLKNGAPGLVNTTINMTVSIVAGVVNFILGVVFAIYALYHKEKLSRQLKQILYAYLPEKQSDQIISIAVLSQGIFSKFIVGQCTEAVIIGILCFGGMLIFSMPYAPMVSALVGFTALIPIFGAFIGTAVGAFLILMVDPMKALWFVVFIIVLQQLEGDLIYPKVVGDSVGLPSIWVLVAVTVGGSMFGILGMLLGVPICSVGYCLLRQAVGRRLRERKIKENKLE